MEEKLPKALGKAIATTRASSRAKICVKPRFEQRFVLEDSSLYLFFGPHVGIISDQIHLRF